MVVIRGSSEISGYPLMPHGKVVLLHYLKVKCGPVMCLVNEIVNGTNLYYLQEGLEPVHICHNYFPTKVLVVKSFVMLRCKACQDKDCTCE